MTTPLQNFDLYDEPSSTAADVYVTCRHGPWCCLPPPESDAVRRADQQTDDNFDEQLIKALTLCYWSGRKDAVDITRIGDTSEDVDRRAEEVVAYADARRKEQL